MSFFAPAAPPRNPWPTGSRPSPGLSATAGEAFAAARTATNAVDLATSERQNLWRALDEIAPEIERLGLERPALTRGGAPMPVGEDRWGAISAMLGPMPGYTEWYAALPAGARGTLPSPAQLEYRAREIALERYAGAEETLSRVRGFRAGAAAFGGGAVEFVADPPNFLSLFTGAGVARTMLGAVGREAAVGAAIEGAQQPQVQAYRGALGLPAGTGQALRNTALAGAFGGAFGGGAHALGRFLLRPADARALVDHVADIESEAPRADIPEGRGAHRAAVAEAEAALVENRAPRIAQSAALVEAGPIQPLRTVDADSELRLFDPDELGVDARRFQFKEGGDGDGVTDRLRGVETWRPERAGVSLVWQDNAGAYWIADGHQRHGLASRIKAADPAQAPMLTGYVYREADGYSAADVRMLAALKNIAEGTGTALDAAKVFRTAPGADVGLPPNTALVRQGRGLAALSDDAFGMVVNDLADPAHAAAVGRLMADLPEQHAEALRILRQAEPASLAEAENIIRDVRAGGAVTETQTSLFGEEAVTRPLYAERAKVLAAAERALKKDRAAFALLAREDKRLRETGNELNTAANIERAQADGETIEILQRLARRTGPVADALNAAARGLADGGSLQSVVGDFTAAVRGADLRAGGGGADAGVAGDAAGRADGSPDEGAGARAVPDRERVSHGEGNAAGLTARVAGLEAEGRADQAALFDDPASDAARTSADPIAHELRDAIAKGDDPLITLDDGRTLRASELLDELDADDAELARLQGCLL